MTTPSRQQPDSAAVRAEDARRQQLLHRRALAVRRAQFERPILTVSIRDGVQLNRLQEITPRR